MFVCGNCEKPIVADDARFCCYCGVRLGKDAMEQSQSCQKERELTTFSVPHLEQEKQIHSNAKSMDQSANKSSYSAEDLHSFALRFRERVIRMNGNARRGFRSITDGMDSGTVSFDYFVDAIRSTWGFASIPIEFVEAIVEKYLARGNNFVSFESFSNFIANGPDPLAVCSDEQTALSAILLPIQESFLRKHYNPHAAFLSIQAAEPGVVTIDEIRRHIEKYLRVASLTNINDATFKDAVKRAANCTGDKLTYLDFSRMLSYPYVDQKQWRQPSASPVGVDDDNHPYRKYY